MIKIMMMKVRRRQEEEEVGRDVGSRGGTREDCEGCDRVQTETENRDSPPGFSCLFQLTRQTPKQTHTYTHRNTHTGCLRPVGVSSFFSVVGCLEQPHF